MTTIVVTEVAELQGRDVPVEALIFHPVENCVTYSRLLVPPASVAELLDAGFEIRELHLVAGLN